MISLPLNILATLIKPKTLFVKLILHLHSGMTLFSELHFLIKINFNNIQHSKTELIVLRVNMFTNNTQMDTCTEVI